MKRIIVFLALLVAFSACNSHKYFEGKVTIHPFGTDSSSDSTNSLQFFHGKDSLLMSNAPAILFTPNRIRIATGKNGDTLSSSSINGLLIRLDKKDFVFNVKGLTVGISKKGLESYLNFFKNIKIDTNSSAAAMGMAMVQAKMPEITFTKKDTEKKMNGFQARKFVLNGSFQNKQGKAVIWMTRNIHINWGMLADLWHQSINFPSKTKFSNYIFKKGYFPVELTVYLQGKKLGGVDIEATKMKIDSSKVQLPEHVKMTSLSEYISKMFEGGS
jgi:hypothetical protein